ncbi:MAG TPA: metal-dependent transcriptional regulator [Acidimicrobiales bacterium]|nr:metal-dependent transcriptional regulator [Acidimicrobiales bacterium]
MGHLAEAKGDGAHRASGGRAGAPSPAASRYLEAIYYMVNEGETVRPGRLAEWLGVSPPTVTVALQRLARDGLVTLGADRTVSFTRVGERAAAVVVRRHRVVECWLTEELGFDWATADAEAEKVALSDVVLDRLYERLGEPATCPHGNEIPGTAPGKPRVKLVALAGLPPGEPARVSRISELAEHDAPQVLTLLDSEGLVPGAEVEVEAGTADPGVLRVRVGGGRSVPLSLATARSVWVDTGGG